MNFRNIDIEIKISYRENLEIFITKQKELTEIIEAISELLPFFSPNIKIDESSNNYYILTGKDDRGKFAVLNTIIEITADSYLGFENAPDFYI